jgi:DNA-binding MarR family transcriptional regulator/GNAT superfamily N-acetyltransferase
MNAPHSTHHDDDVAALRAFNRAYTRRLGLLNAHYDRSPFSLSEARVLYELAHRSDPTSADIMRALDLDRAQLSRTLKRFADRGLVEMRPGAGDARHRLLALTAAGQAAYAELEGNTKGAVGALLDGLSPARRTRLLAAARAIEQVFAETPAAVTLRDPKPGDLGWIVHRQAALYAAEYGWNSDYEALAVRILADFVDGFDPAGEAAWIAEQDGRIVGSIFLVHGAEPDLGKLRLLYVEPDARGSGVGAMLVAACVERARAVGYRRLDLWTNSVLTAARRIYERAGFVLVDEAPHRSFGHDLVGQTWSLDLG